MSFNLNSVHPPPIIFTDLDGTLLHPQTYDCDGARPLIATLQRAGIAIIPVTSKTRAEVEELRTHLGLSGPFIVENGSGIFIPSGDPDWRLSALDTREHYDLIQLGCSYEEACRGLRALETLLGQPLQGFSDLTVSELQQLTNLSRAAVHRAQAREFSEPFLLPSAPLEALTAAALSLGFQLVVGGRFGHLIGRHAGKGNAVHALLAYYQQRQPEWEPITIGLGDSPNDLALLAAVDYPVIIPGLTGHPHPQLAATGGWVAAAPAPEGWVQGVQHAFAQLSP